ncbi:MAG: hypothetical protein JNK10_01610 [Cyclobacteriaceae bacterium]|nr:hypothetical protein [Cyclobacteriaceae bacterium]
MATRIINIFNIRHRLTQVLVFVICVTACMLFSQVAEAGIGGPKPKRYDKPKYRVAVHSNSNRVVKVLYWKRRDAPKSSFVASNRKARKQAMAETDTAY